MPLVPGAIDRLAHTPSVLRALLDAVPPEALTSPDAGGWSTRDVVSHLLIITDLGLDQRLRLLLAEDTPTLPDVNEHDSLAASGYRDRPPADLLDDFAAHRANTVEWIRGLGPADLERAGIHEITGRVTASDVVHHIAFHDLVHVAQITNLIAAPLNAARGGMGNMGSRERSKPEA
ncbi:MAG: DinB superfamily protein [Chloroflexi bacterium]|nr:MAG: DinB superfamily protein [Chloroflexota bacterium]